MLVGLVMTLTSYKVIVITNPTIMNNKLKFKPWPHLEGIIQSLYSFPTANHENYELFTHKRESHKLNRIIGSVFVIEHVFVSSGHSNHKRSNSSFEIRVDVFLTFWGVIFVEGKTNFQFFKKIIQDEIPQLNLNRSMSLIDFIEFINFFNEFIRSLNAIDDVPINDISFEH